MASVLQEGERQGVAMGRTSEPLPGGCALKAGMRTSCLPDDVLFLETNSSSSVLSVFPSLPGADLSPEIIPQDGTNRLGDMFLILYILMGQPDILDLGLLFSELTLHARCAQNNGSKRICLHPVSEGCFI